MYCKREYGVSAGICTRGICCWGICLEGNICCKREYGVTRARRKKGNMVLGIEI